MRIGSEINQKHQIQKKKKTCLKVFVPPFTTALPRINKSHREREREREESILYLPFHLVGIRRNLWGVVS